MDGSQGFTKAPEMPTAASAWRKSRHVGAIGGLLEESVPGSHQGLRAGLSPPQPPRKAQNHGPNRPPDHSGLNLPWPPAPHPYSALHSRQSPRRRDGLCHIMFLQETLQSPPFL